MASVFISYAREDIRITRRLYNDLRSNDVDCWLDVESLNPGQRWKSSIRQEIRNCKYFVALISQSSIGKRGFVQAELHEALQILEETPEGEVFIIPVRLDHCEVTNAVLNELHWVDSSQSYDSGLARIVQAIQQGQKGEMAATNLTLGGHRPAHKSWTRADFIDSIWHQEIEDGDPNEAHVLFKADGSFLYKDFAPQEFGVTSKPSSWDVSSSLLALSWNDGYNIDAFTLPGTATAILYGTQSVGYKRIIFRRAA